MNSYLIYNLLVAHVVADFYAQGERCCRNKYEKGLKGWGIYVHFLLVFALSWLAVWDCRFWWGSLVIAVSHLAVDALKSRIERMEIKDEDGNPVQIRNSRWDLCVFALDQIGHLVILLFVGLWWNRTTGNSWFEIPWILGIKQTSLLVVLAVLVLMTPSNILIKLIFQKYTIRTDRNEEKGHGSFRSGALIGSLERLIVFAFILLRQYEAIGLLVAAKSIIRFSGTKESEQSEYVLVGTLLSIALVILFGIVANQGQLF